MFQILSKFMLWSKIFGGVRVLTQREVEIYMRYSGETHTYCVPFKDRLLERTIGANAEARACPFQLSAQLHDENSVTISEDCFDLLGMDFPVTDVDVDVNTAVPLSAGNDTSVSGSDLRCLGCAPTAKCIVSSC